MSTEPHRPAGTPSRRRSSSGRLPPGRADVAPEAPVRQASSLGPRIISAAVAVPVLAVLIWFGFWPVTILVVAATLLSLYELFQVLERGGYHPRRLVGMIFGLGFCASAVCAQFLGHDFAGVALALSLLLGLVVELAQRDHKGALLSWALTFSGACYVGWLLSHYILIQAINTPLLTDSWLAALQMSPGSAWIYTVLAITWLQDTGAYFAGRSFGRHKMAPYLSPKKTWEGAVGGLLSALIVGLLAKPLLGLPISYLGAALLGIVGGIAGPLGDLAESLIKRQVNVKDAGTLIPGHGGILDRIDSMLFTGPVLYYLILLLT